MWSCLETVKDGGDSTCPISGAAAAGTGNAIGGTMMAIGGISGARTGILMNVNFVK